MESKRECVDPDCGVMLAAYEMGLLVSDDRVRFERHLSHCKVCQEQLYAMAPNMITMQANATDSAHTLASQLRSSAMAHASMNDLEKELKREAELSKRRASGDATPSGSGWGEWLRAIGERIWPAHGRTARWATMAPIAITALLVVVIALQQAGQSPDWASHAQIEPVAYVPQSTRDAASGDAGVMMSAGMLAYVGGSYEEAAPLLAEAADLMDPGATRDQARFFAGLSFLLVGDTEAARLHLEVAASSEILVVADRSQWYLAQLNLLEDQPEDARRLLKELAAGSPGYRVQAAELLGELESVKGKPTP